PDRRIGIHQFDPDRADFVESIFGRCVAARRLYPWRLRPLGFAGQGDAVSLAYRLPPFQSGARASGGRKNPSPVTRDARSCPRQQDIGQTASAGAFPATVVRYINRWYLV